MERRIRVATESDASDIRDIYAPVVTDTPISFEIAVPSIAEFAQRIQNTLVQYPWLVYQVDRSVVGYVYASTHRVRQAYQWSTEVTVYVHQDHRGAGIGNTLYKVLFEILKLQGYRSAIGGITLPNVASVAIHESLGFKQVAHFPSIGYKQGAWHDVGFWQLELQPFTRAPPVPIPFEDLPKTKYEKLLVP